MIRNAAPPVNRQIMKLNNSLNKIKQKTCKVLKKRHARGRVNGDIHAIRSGYLAQIEAKRKEIADLQDKLKRAERVAKESQILFDPVDKYRGKGLTEAVLDAVKSLIRIGTGETGGVSAGQVCDYLKGHGFACRSPNFTVSVYVTLQRLSAPLDGRLIVSSESGKKRYKPHDISEFK